jgi:Pectate lyase superfamily protein
MAGQILDVVSYGGAKGDGTTDDTAAFAACINQTNSLYSSGIDSVVISIPEGQFYINGSTLPTFTCAGAIVGQGVSKSMIKVGTSYTGDVFSWSDAWLANSMSTDNTISTPSTWKAGPIAKDFMIYGNRSSTHQVNGLCFYDHTEHAYIQNVNCHYLPGRALYFGASKNDTNSYFRESHIRDFRSFHSGATGIPVVEFTSSGTDDACNAVVIDGCDIYAPYGTGFLLNNNCTTAGIRDLRINKLRVEGYESNPHKVAADLVQIGTSSSTGEIWDILFCQVTLLNQYVNYAALRFDSLNENTQPYFITLHQGYIGGGTAAGYGLIINSGAYLSLQFLDLHALQTCLTVGPSPKTGANIIVDGGGTEAGWTTSIDPSASTFVLRPTRQTF